MAGAITFGIRKMHEARSVGGGVRRAGEWTARVLLFLLCLVPAITLAQTTTGNSTTGQTLYNTHCDGCHGATVGSVSAAIKNAANAGGIINTAMGNGMGGYTTGSFTSTQENDMAAYIATVVTSPNPSLSAVSHNTAKLITLPNVFVNTAYGVFTTGTFSSGASRGGVTFSTSGTSLRATYTPDTGQCGTDTVNYRATNGGAITSNLRSFSVDIADPAAPNISTSASTKTGTYLTALTYTPTSTGGTPYSYAISVGTLPTGLSLNTTSGVISGSPTQTGAFNVTLQARNCLNGNLTGQTSSRAIAITINKASQSALTALINASSANAAFTYQSPNGTATLSSSGGSGTGAVSYSSSNTAVCTVSSTTLTLVGAGTCTITATKAADANYNLATDTIGVTVNKASQTITFNAQTTATRSFVQGGTFAVSPPATTTSGLAISYDSNTPTVCTLPGDTTTTVTMVAAGTCTIGANQAGNTNYNAATEATQSVTINAIAPQPPTIGAGVGGNGQAVVNFTPPTNTGGTAILDYTATCSASGQTTRTATVAGSPATVLSMTNGVTYSCSVTARNAVGPSAASGTVMVTPTSSPSITSQNNATFTIGSAGTFTVTATGAPTPTLSMSGALPSGVSFTAGTGVLAGTPAAGTAASYPLTFTATNAGGSSMQAFTLTVQKANQTITFGALADRPMRPISTALSATASSGLPVALTVSALTAGNCFLSGNNLFTTNVGTCTVLANQAGNTSFNAAAQVSRSFIISQGNQTLLWDPQPSGVYSPGGSVAFGSKASSVDPVDLSSATGLDPVYNSLTPAICSYTDNAVAILGAGTCTVEVSQPGDANYAAATPITGDIIISMATQAISWGAQSDQSFGTGGTFSISPLATGGASGNSIVYGSTTPAVCTVTGTTVTKVSAGGCTLTANQAGDDNYAAAAQVSRSLVISASAPTAPTATDIVASDSQVVISFDPPASDGGNAISSYRATCLPGPVIADGASSPITVTGLTNGTPYTCVVRAQNSAGFGTASNALMATPILDTGANLWANVCSGCHGGQPAGVRFNAAGTTGAVINYARAVQSNMLSTNAVQALTLNELAEIAKYIETFVPAISLNTAYNTPVNVDVSSHLTLGTISFSSAEVVTAPLHGTLGPFTGTAITYTPTPGYVGVDSFTYRGNQNAPGVPGDAHTVTITIAAPPAPAITSPAIFAGVFGAATSYQITATNSPTSYGASGLGAGFTINTVTGLISGTPNAAGSFSITVSASNAGGTGMQVVDVTVSKAGQVITFDPQAGQAYSPGGTFPLSPTASASSGLAVSYSSLTPAVCTIASVTITMVSAGTCTIAANQAGNTNYSAALQVTQGINISATVPGAPTIGTATAGDTTASIGFTAPANNGGSPITGYTAACTPGPVGAGGLASPITVTGLANATVYSCAVRATNAAGNGAFSGTVMVTPTATPVAPQIVSASTTTFTVGSAGNFTVSATGVPAPSLALVGALPSGVSFTPASGALAGTPAFGSGGSYPVTITATGTAPAAMQSFTLVVQKANQSIAFTGPASQAFTSTPIVLSATSMSGMAATGLTVVFASNSPTVCSVSGTTLTLLAIGTCSLTASQEGDTNYNAATPVNQDFIVSQATQTINFPAQSVASRSFVPGGTFFVSPTASASSGLTVLYSSTTPAVCTIMLNTITMVAPGLCTIAANQSGSANYFAAPQVTRSVTLNATAPDAPTIGTATPGNTQASIAFTAPANNGGSAIIGYTATCNPGGIAVAGGASPIVVTGLTNNIQYTCSVTATNGVGTSAASASVNVTPLSGQGITMWQNVCSFCHGSVPIGNQLNAAGTTATVLDYVRNQQTVMKIYPPVTALTQSDLADIAAYIATEIPANDVTTSLNTQVLVDVGSHIRLTGQSWAAFDSVEVVTPPANGSLSAFAGTVATYTPANGYLGADSFTYRGKLNGVHVGDPHTVSIMVNPASPVISSAGSATGTFGLTFSYQITATNVPTSFDAVNLPAGLAVDTVTGLISGTPTTPGSFIVSITATNAGGFGQAALMLQIDRAPQVITFAAQTSPRAYASGGSFAISPLAVGGLSGNPVVYGSATTSVCTVSGTTVTMVAAGVCTITASQAGSTNYAAAIQVSQDVTINPVVPGPPFIGVATGSNAQASVAFSAPADNGGSPIVSYTATCGMASASGPVSPITVTGLTNGVQVACSVTAANIAGTGPSSGSVNVTPTAATIPGAPVIGTATAGDSQASIAFSAPASNGGSTITGYTATCNPGDITGAGTVSPIIVSGLTNGVAYGCSVRATNSIGTGAASATVSVTPLSPITFNGSVVSRKSHGAAGIYPFPISNVSDINGAISVEPRMPGAGGHVVVFDFTGAVTSVGAVAVVDALGAPVGSAIATAVGNTVEVALSGIPDNQRVSISVAGVNGSASATVAIGFLVGDMNDTRRVTGADISAIKSRIGQPIGTGDNRLFDINLDGAVTQLDVNSAKARAGKVIP